MEKWEGPEGEIERAPINLAWGPEGLSRPCLPPDFLSSQFIYSSLFITTFHLSCMSFPLPLPRSLFIHPFSSPIHSGNCLYRSIFFRQILHRINALIRLHR